MSKDPEISSKSDSIPNTSISTYHIASRCRRWSRNGFSTGMKCLQNPYNFVVNGFSFIFVWSIIVVVVLLVANTLQTSAKRVYSQFAECS